MGKRDRNETKEERRARKKAKKEAKKRKQEQQRKDSAAVASSVADGSSRDAEPTPFQKKRLEMVVSLYPSALGDVLMHVRESLNSLLLKYSDGVGGIMLAFDNVELAKDEKTGEASHGVILNELPQIHYTVQLDALVFCPRIGIKLTGVVNECFPSHVGMLVHSFFNAMVSSDHLHSAGYVYDQELQEWTQEEGSGVLGNEDRVEFIVQKVHECAGVISIEGSNPNRIP